MSAVRRRLLTACGIALLAVGCYMPAAPEAPPARSEEAGPGGRRQNLALTPRQEYAAGQRAYQEVMNEFRGNVLPTDDPEVARVRKVVGRLARAAEIELLQREILLRVRGYRFDWEANVVRNRQVNAFCLPAGKIFVFTGILRLASDDDQLAAVLSHEIAHALAHHASERIARAQSSAGVLRSLSYDRFQESEADHIGVFLMAFAGYDPNAATAFWQRMRQARGGQGAPPEFLSDHPSDERRIRDLAEWAPKARAAKRAFDEGRVAR